MIVRAIFIRIYIERRVWVVWFLVYLFVFFVMFLRSHTHTRVRRLMTCVFFTSSRSYKRTKKRRQKSSFFFAFFHHHHHHLFLSMVVDHHSIMHRPYYMHMNKSSFFGCLEDNLFTITLHTHPNHITSSLDFFFLTSSSLKK